MSAAPTVPLPSVDVLTAALVDYAGLFPPAALDMRTAVHNYAAYRAGPTARLLGRFIVPAARLAEFAAAAVPLWPHRQSDEPWRVSALATANLALALEQVEAFNRDHAPHAVVDSIELPADTEEAIQAAAASVPSSMVRYVEIPLAAEPGPLLAMIRRTHARAKVRTGGVVATAIPPSSAIARFLFAAARARAPFKATAGLHHAMRAMHHLTYERASPSAVMHGFLNVFLAAAVAHAGGREDQILGVLDETSSEAFVFDANVVRWRDVSVSLAELRAVRADFAVAFGSCSFLEPVEDLRTLGLL
jgi:hypothetical protein